MRLAFVAFALTFVDCKKCPDVDTECKRDETKCPGGVDDDNCPIAPICIPRNFKEWPLLTSLTFKDCSEGSINCRGGFDNNGCPTSATCKKIPPKADESDKCSDRLVGLCDAPKCEPPNLLCPLTEKNGCRRTPICQRVDPLSPCSGKAFCDVECKRGERKCPGGFDEDKCPIAPTCIDRKSTRCMDIKTDWKGCPMVCDQGMKICGKVYGGKRRKGCKMWSSCYKDDYKPVGGVKCY